MHTTASKDLSLGGDTTLKLQTLAKAKYIWPPLQRALKGPAGKKDLVVGWTFWLELSSCLSYYI